MKHLTKGLVSKLALVAGLTLGAGTAQEAEAQSKSPYNNDVSLYFKVRGNDGAETRVLRPGETYSLEVLARAPGTKTICTLDVAVDAPSQVTIVDQVVNNPNYGTNDFFQGVSMRNGLNFAAANNYQRSISVIRYADRKINNGSTSTNGIIGAFSFNVNSSITNLESAVFDICKGAKGFEGISQDAYWIPVKDTRLPVVIVPNSKLTEPKLFMNSTAKSSTPQDGGYHYGGNFYPEKENFASPFGYAPEKGCILQSSNDGKEWTGVLTNNVMGGFVEFPDCKSSTNSANLYRLVIPNPK
ncbi:MAG: hypothetical protein AABX07_05460 [Nanoarchaeota archaeon]